MRPDTRGRRQRGKGVLEGEKEFVDVSCLAFGKNRPTLRTPETAHMLWGRKGGGGLLLFRPRNAGIKSKEEKPIKYIPGDVGIKEGKVSTLCYEISQVEEGKETARLRRKRTGGRYIKSKRIKPEVFGAGNRRLLGKREGRKGKSDQQQRGENPSKKAVQGLKKLLLQKNKHGDSKKGGKGYPKGKEEGVRGGSNARKNYPC